MGSEEVGRHRCQLGDTGIYARHFKDNPLSFAMAMVAYELFSTETLVPTENSIHLIMLLFSSSYRKDSAIPGLKNQQS
jgi:hypothetical protein